MPDRRETVAARCCSESADELDVDAAAGAEAEQGVHDAAAVGLGVVLADDEDSYHNPSIANLVRFFGGGSRVGACRILVARRSCASRRPAWSGWRRGRVVGAAGSPVDS